jgi:hypothetical protein
VRSPHIARKCGQVKQSVLESDVGSVVERIAIWLETWEVYDKPRDEIIATILCLDEGPNWFADLLEYDPGIGGSMLRYDFADPIEGHIFTTTISYLHKRHRLCRSKSRTMPDLATWVIQQSLSWDWRWLHQAQKDYEHRLKYPKLHAEKLRKELDKSRAELSELYGLDFI